MQSLLSIMEELFNKIKEFILPLFILIQLLIVGLKKFMDRKNEQKKIKQWEEYAKRLGFPLLKYEGKRERPYIRLHFGGKIAFVLEWAISGGTSAGLALIIGINNMRIDEDFQLKRKFSLFSKEQKGGLPGSNIRRVENKYNIIANDESFKRKFLTSRLLNGFSGVKPDSMFFFGRDDIRATVLPEESESELFLAITINRPEDYKKINELIELGRLTVRILDSI